MGSKQAGNDSKMACWAAVGLLMLLFALLVLGEPYVSLTSDEMAHVAFGYSMLAEGKDAFWIVPLRGHPPLINVLEAWLPYLSNPHIPVQELKGWGEHLPTFREELAFQLFRVEPAHMGWYRFDPPLKPERRPSAGSPGSSPSPPPAPLLSRMPVMFLTVLLGAIVFRWAKEMWGLPAGLLALFVLSLDPTLIAHGRLATNDAGTVTFGTAALYATWRWLETPRWRWALATGALLGITMLSKATGLLWTAAVALMIVQRAAATQRHLLRFLLQGGVIGLLSLFVIWAGYGFTWGAVPGIPIALPAPTYWEGCLFQTHSVGQRWVFALGMRKQGRWWWYFPLAFLIKNPLPLLIAVAIGAILLFRQPARFRPLLPVILFPLLYAAVAIRWGLNIGYRHILPLHPYLYLLVGGGVGAWLRNHKSNHREVLPPSVPPPARGRFCTHLNPPTCNKGNRKSKQKNTATWMLVILSLWLMLETLIAFPNEIAYFNQLVGGSESGYRYLSDSNVEWGQSSKVLYDYLATHPTTKPNRPSYSFLPEPGRYIVNMTHLQGISIDNPYAYEWFRHQKPADRLNETLLLYDVPDHGNIAWIAQCDTPAIPLSETAIVEGTGREDLRQVTFDCGQSWIYPGGGKQAGLYALHYYLVQEQDLCLPEGLRCPPVPYDAFMIRHLGWASLSFEQEMHTPSNPAMLLYEMPATSVLPSVVAVGYAAQASTTPAQLAPPLGISLPVSFEVSAEGVSTQFLGATLAREGSPSLTLPARLRLGTFGLGTFRQEEREVAVETWWQITEGRLTRPLSIMAHLITESGEPLGVADGLGISPLYLQPGDIIVQRHRFPAPQEGTQLWLRTGLYWTDSLERWTVGNPTEADAIFILLE